MSDLNLWDNPNISMESRLSIAIAEIKRLKDIIARSDYYADKDMTSEIQAGARIGIIPMVVGVCDRDYYYDDSVRGMVGAALVVEKVDVDSTGENVYVVKFGYTEYGLYRDWIFPID